MVHLIFENENGSRLEQMVVKSSKLKYIARYEAMGFKLTLWSNQ